MQVTIPHVGDIIRLTQDAHRCIYTGGHNHSVQIPQGSTGQVVEVTSYTIGVKMDAHFDSLDVHHNTLYWSPRPGDLAFGMLERFNQDVQFEQKNADTSNSTTVGGSNAADTGVRSG